MLYRDKKYVLTNNINIITDNWRLICKSFDLNQINGRFCQIVDAVRVTIKTLNTTSESLYLTCNLLISKLSFSKAKNPS